MGITKIQIFRRFGFVFAVLCIGALARSDELADIGKKLDAVRLQMSSAKAMANADEVYDSPAPAPRTDVSLVPSASTSSPPRIKPSSIIWAFSGQKRYREVAKGYATAYDGINVSRRTVSSGGPAIGDTSIGHVLPTNSGTQVYGEIYPGRDNFSPLVPDPIEAGYEVNWTSLNSPTEQLWLSQAIRRLRPQISKLANGDIGFEWEYSEASLRRKIAVQLDPRQGYLIVRSDYRTQRRSPRGDVTYWNRYRVQILESKDMGGWHLPTRVVQESFNEKGKATYRSEIRLSNVRTDFSDRIFTEVFKPGDIVRMTSTYFRVQDDGALIEFQPPSWDEHAVKETQREYVLVVGTICGTLIAGFLLIYGLRRSRLNRT